MNDINALTDINFIAVFLGLFIILIAFNKILDILGSTAKHIKKPINWFQTRDKDHELILANAEAIKNLAELHEKDNKISNEHDDMIRDELSIFMIEVKDDIKKFTDNRVNDRNQSLQIQKELTEAIKSLTESEKTRNEQIEILMCGSKELLGNTIDERYEKYIELGGIPQNEVDEFDSIYEAYKNLNGNHGREAKHEYVKKHLPIIPVKTELVIKHE